jgi:hypothetical protein
MMLGVRQMRQKKPGGAASRAGHTFPGINWSEKWWKCGGADRSLELMSQPSDIRRVVIASFIGTTIEWYDFFLYGTASALVFNKLLFPSLDLLMGTMAAFATYAVGFSRGLSAASCSAILATKSAASRCW